MMALVIVIVGFVALAAGMAVLNGFIISYVWEWFMVPFGLPSISVVHAIGLAILASILTHDAGTSKSDDPWKPLVVAVIARLIAFGVAFVLSGFVP